MTDEVVNIPHIIQIVIPSTPRNAPHGATQTIVPPSASQATLLSTPRVQQTPASCPSSTTSSNMALASLLP